MKGLRAGSFAIGLSVFAWASVHARDTLAGSPSPEAAEAHARLRQNLLPALTARRDAATSLSSAMDQWFAGTLPLPSAALPDTAGLSLLDPAIAWGAIRALDVQAEARAAERVAPLPAHLAPADIQRLRTQRAATLDAEDAAAAKVRRFWLGLLAGTETAPGLRADALAHQHLRLQERAPTPATINAEGLADDAAAAALARGQAQAALHNLQAAAVRAATVPGDATLDRLVAADHTAVSTWLSATPDPSIPPPAEIHDAADRLQRASPLSSVPAAPTLEQWETRQLEQTLHRLDAERVSLEARLADASADPGSSVEVAERQVEQARLHASDVLTAQLQLGETLSQTRIPDPGLTVRDAFALQAAASRVQLANLRVQLAERTLEQARVTEAAGTAAVTTDDDVAQARAEAEAAQAEAERAAEQDALEADTQLRQQIAAYSNRRAELLSERQSREQAAEDQRTEQTRAITEQRTNMAAALSLGQLDRERQGRLDEVYLQSRSIVATLRGQITAMRSQSLKLVGQREAELEALPSTRSTLPNGMDSVLVSRWQEELSRLREALDHDISTAGRDTGLAMDLLGEAKDFRRSAREHASGEARARVQSTFFAELGHEVHEIPGILSALALDAARLVRFLPTMLLDLGLVGRFFRGSFELVMVLLLWGFTRERTGGWLRSVLGTLRAVRPGDAGLAARLHDWVGARGEAGDWAGLEGIAFPVLLALSDCLTGFIAVALVPSSWSVVQLLVFLWLARSVWKLGTGLVPMLFPAGVEDRPGLRRVSEPGRARLLRSVQIVIGWAILGAFAERFTLDILDADRLHDLVSWVGALVGWVLGIGLLHTWAPELRQALNDAHSDPVSRFVSQQSDSVLLRAPLAGLCIAVFAVRLLSGTVQNLVEQRSGLGWIRTAMARQSLKTTDDAPTQRLPAEVRAQLSRFDPAVVSTDDEAAQLTQSFAAWRTEGRRGMVAITGQRGAGKSRLLRRIPELIGPGAGGLSVHTIRLNRDIFDADEALRWLVQTLTHDPTATITNPDDAARQLSALPPAVYVVDDLHRCFLRAVGGFRGLRQILTAMHAASSQHFWVCAFHGDNWSYLEGVGNAVNLGVFRKRILMRPMTAAELRDWLEAHTEAAGLRPTYDDLATEGWISTDPERTRERARSAYFRLLAEATRGNPVVALSTWCRSLRVGPEPGTVAVVLFDQPNDQHIAEGGEHALFVLAALVVHDGLDVQDLVRVLNLHEATCRATCRRLEGLGILESDDADEHFDIALAWAPVVYRHLRQKHLLHRD